MIDAYKAATALRTAIDAAEIRGASVERNGEQIVLILNSESGLELAKRLRALDGAMRMIEESLHEAVEEMDGWPDDKLVGVDVAAYLLDKHPETIRRLVREKKLRAVRARGAGKGAPFKFRMGYLRSLT